MQTRQKKKAAAPSLKDCANCETNGAKLTCAKCKATHYCSKACQKQHWKNGHKAICVTPEERRRSHMMASAPDKSNRGPADAEGNSGECPICLESFSGGTLCTLPCKHEFHRDCVEELRKQGVQQACPICRSALPPGPEQLFEDATRLYVRVEARHRAEEGSWKTMTAAEKENMAHVIELLTNAANQGHNRAAFNLGFIFLTGSGTTQDFKKAVQWYQKAADRGLADAQFNLGDMYLYGKGVAQDHKKAAQWILKAADQGLATAQEILGNMIFNGQGAAQDFNEAQQWFRKAADQGLASAQFNLGHTYFSGKGVAQDYKKAVQWYRKAADQGFARAQCNLGERYRQGEGVAQDCNEAVQWYRKAADQGLANAQFNLGNMYREGEGVAQDNKKAAHWYRKAADQGLANAQSNLGERYYNGHGEFQDYNKAAHWYQKAADQGNGNAQFRLGGMYYWGEGVAQDSKQALFFLSAAAAQGIKEAGELRQDIEALLHLTSSEFSGLEKSSSSQCTCCGRDIENTVKLKPCPRCKGPLYCGKECQSKHWKNGHKECCKKI